MGDAHSNPLKIIAELSAENVITLSAEHYKKLLSFYQEDYYNHEKDRRKQIAVNLDKFKEQLKQITVSNPNNFWLILLGDETGDRGLNDIYILYLLEALLDKGVKYTILLSNHGMAFLLTMLKWRSLSDSYFSRSDIDSYYMGRESDYSSLKSMIDFLGDVDYKQLRPSILTLFEKCYLPYLKVLDYATINHNQSTYIALCSHSYAHQEVLKKVAKDFGVNWPDNLTAENLISTIDDINTNLKKLLDNNEFSQGIMKKSGLYQLVWGRVEKNDNSHQKTIDWLNTTRFVICINGHDTGDSNLKHDRHILLDTIVGKFFPVFNIEENEKQGKYLTFQASPKAEKKFSKASDYVFLPLKQKQIPFNTNQSFPAQPTPIIQPGPVFHMGGVPAGSNNVFSDPYVVPSVTVTTSPFDEEVINTNQNFSAQQIQPGSVFHMGGVPAGSNIIRVSCENMNNSTAFSQQSRGVWGPGMFNPNVSGSYLGSTTSNNSQNGPFFGNSPFG